MNTNLNAKLNTETKETEALNNYDHAYNGQACLSPNFHGAHIIDKDGREIAITETMIQDSCNKLIRVSEFYQRLSSSLKKN